MSRSSMTLKNVMGGCELIDLRPPILEKSWFIDLSLIGVNLHELQKNLISDLSNNPDNTEGISNQLQSVNLASITGYEFGAGQSCVFESKDNNDDYSAARQIDEEVMLKSSAQLEPANVQCNLEMFDNMNAIKVAEAEPTELPPPVFTSLQNFYETFDVSDQIETMTVMDSIADTPSSVSTFDSSFEQDLVISYEPNSSVYYDNFEVASDHVPSPSTENQNELYFIPNAEYPQDLTHLLCLQKIAKRALGINVEKSDEKSDPKEKKRKPGRVSRKPVVEKNISCSSCSRKFRTEAHLKAHFKVHMDSAEYMYSCIVCDRRFCHRGALALHARRHTPRPEFGTPY